MAGMIVSLDRQQKRYIGIGFLIAGLAVVFGAFGSHALKAKITPHYLDVFQTANRYHFIHALGMVLCVYVLSGLASKSAVRRIFIFFLIGLILFSGSLYILSIAEMIGVPQLKMMGAITPIGGLFFIMAWLYSAYLMLKS